MTKIACENTILYVGGEYIISPAVVTVAQNKIQDVRKLSLSEYKREVSLNLEKDGFTELKDKVLSPAFVNSHTHLAMNFIRSVNVNKHSKTNLVESFFFVIEKFLTPQDVKVFTQMGAYESLLTGTGFVWDFYCFSDSMASGMLEAGLSGGVASAIQDLSGPFKNQWEDEFERTFEVDTPKFAEGGIYPVLGPQALDTVSDDLFKKIINQARESNYPIHFHCAQSYEEFQKISTTRNSKSCGDFMERIGLLDSDLSVLMAHGIYLNQEDLKKVAKAKKTLVFCPYSQMIFCFPADVNQWNQAGIQWVVATDSSACNDSLNVQRELGYLASQNTLTITKSEEYRKFYSGEISAAELNQYRNKTWQGVDTNAVLDRVWRLPSKIHPEYKVGLIEKDHLANFAVWDKSHPSFWPFTDVKTFVLSDCTKALENMMVSGKWISPLGTSIHTTVLESEVYQQTRKEATLRLESLMKKYLNSL